MLRLQNRGRHLSYQRGKRITNPNTSLIQIGKENPSTLQTMLAEAREEERI